MVIFRIGKELRKGDKKKSFVPGNLSKRTDSREKILGDATEKKGEL